MAFEMPAGTHTALSDFYSDYFSKFTPNSSTSSGGALRSGQVFIHYQANISLPFLFKYTLSQKLEYLSVELDSLDNNMQVKIHKCEMSTPFSFKIHCKNNRNGQTAAAMG